MGREVKRVAADFKWPLNEVWAGYINPWYKFSLKCEECENGYNEVGHRYYQEWYGYTDFDPVAYGSNLITKDTPEVIAYAQRNVTRDKDFYTKNGYLTEDQAVICEAERLANLWAKRWSHNLIQDEVNALLEEGRLDYAIERGALPKNPTADQVNRWSLGGMGHDCCNASICMNARAKREGHESLECKHCGGTARVWSHPDAEKNYETWEQTEPPSGEAYQIWETVSEGSPVSPAFVNPRELAEWMVNRTYAQKKNDVHANLNVEQWMKFILGPGWAPSGVMSDGKMISGVEFVVQEKSE